MIYLGLFYNILLKSLTISFSTNVLIKMEYAKMNVISK